jgi:hypothetical protein
MNHTINPGHDAGSLSTSPFISWPAISRFCIAFIFVITCVGTQNIYAQEQGKKITPTKTVTINFKEIEKATQKIDTARRKKKVENEAKPPGDLPMPPGGRIIRHNPPAGKDTAKHEIKKKGADDQQPNFPGLGDNNSSIPPDIGGAAGPNHLMVALNSQVRIQDKAGATISTVLLDDFFSSLGGSPNMFDPKVLYDPFAQRWIITAPANSVSANSSLMIGVSATNDPTGIWTLYQFDVDPANLNWFDYPSIGFNKNWIVVTGNMFTISGPFTFQNEAVYVFDKAALYAGATTPTLFSRPTSEGFTVCPAITLDNTQATEYLVSSFNSAAGTLRLYTITGTAAAPVYTATMLFPAAATGWAANPPAGNDFAPQSGDAHLIQNNDRRIQNAVFRGGALWCTHTIFLPAGASPTHSAIQWWQINPVTGTVQQNARIEDATAVNFFAFPTIAVNAYDDALIGYSSFSASQFASANYSFRLHTDALNTFQPTVQFKAGLAKYFKIFTGTLNRWGDYSSTCIDPDDFSMWTIQEYAELPSGGADRWGTEWNKLMPPVAELFSKDRDDDLGAEPNPTTAPMWEAPDIWIRKLQDASHTFAHVHENAEYRTGTSNPNYAYVEVHNRGAAPSAGTEQLTLYWAKASSGLSWPDPWNGGVYFDPGPNTMLMGGVIGTVTIPVIAAGASNILEFAWNPPDPALYAAAFGTGQHHFCLLARITTSAVSPFGMRFTETSNLYANVQNNNNIVWKNIAVLDEAAGTGAPAYAVVANLTDQKMNVKLRFTVLDAEGNPVLLNKGVLKLTIGGKLKDILLKNGITGEGFKDEGNGVMNIEKDGGFLNNIVLDPRDFGTVKMEYIPTNREEKLAAYAITIIQLETTDTTEHIVGGQTAVFGKVKGFSTGTGGGNGHAQGFGRWWHWALILLIILLLGWLLLRRKK